MDMQNNENLTAKNFFAEMNAREDAKMEANSAARKATMARFYSSQVAKLNAQAEALDAHAKGSDHAAAIKVNARETRRSARQFAADLDRCHGHDIASQGVEHVCTDLCSYNGCCR